MNEKERALFDNIWTDVVLTKTILDRGKLVTQEVLISKDEVEREHTEALIENWEGEGEPERVDLPNSTFQSAVMRAARAMTEIPVVLPGEYTNELRLLPPTAVKEVRITVSNLGQVIVA